MALEPFNRIPDPNYYLREQSFPEPEFRGNGARLLGIEGQFSAEMHLRLFDGLNPDTGDRLPGMRAVKNRRGGWDMTFNQEKWLSTLEHVAGDDRISEIRHKARDKAMEYMESRIHAAVRKKSQFDGPRIKADRYRERLTGNIVWAAFNHPAGRDGMPHGHDHVVVYNETWDATEGHFKAAVTRHVEVDVMAEIYHKEQARLLRKIGYDVRREGNRLYLPDFPKDVSDLFTERSPAIKERVKSYEEKAGKPMSSKSRQKVGLFDRPEKEFVAYDLRRRGWLRRITAQQFERLSDLVEGTRLGESLSRWHRQLSQHATKLRSMIISRESDVYGHEREQKHGRSR